MKKSHRVAHENQRRGGFCYYHYTTFIVAVKIPFQKTVLKGKNISACFRMESFLKKRVIYILRLFHWFYPLPLERPPPFFTFCIYLLYIFPLGRHHFLCYTYLSCMTIYLHQLEIYLLLFSAVPGFLTNQKIYFFASFQSRFSSDNNAHTAVS